MRLPINVNNVIGRHKEPFLESGYRFPTTKEVNQAVTELVSDFNQRNALIDRFFPVDSTFASELQMYVLRTQNGNEQGMTMVHQIGSNVLPTDVRVSQVDLSRASWSPLAFKESRTWDEKEMLHLGRLTEEVQKSEIDAQIGDFLAWLMRRMVNRTDHLCWQIMRNGKITIDGTDPNNASNLRYDIDYGVTDMRLPLPVKFDAKDSEGKSLVDPIEYFNELKRAAKWNPDIMPVELIVNSTFVDILTDNTFVQYLVDWERGWTAIEMRPPRSVYRNAALEIFTRYTGLTVTLEDGTYEDEDGVVHYWMPNGEMAVICKNTSPLGTFTYTAHVAGSSNGKVLLGTGPYIHIQDETLGDPPFYKVIGGFHGLPQLKGYSHKDFSYNRLKWLNYAEGTTVEGYQVPFPDPFRI